MAKQMEADFVQMQKGEPMSDLIDRQAAIEVIDAVFPVDPMKSEYAQGIACGAALAKTYVEQLPSAQPEQNNASEFWRKRADFYSDMCMSLIGEMGKGVKVESVKISENGIEFIKEQPPAQPTEASCWGCNCPKMERLKEQKTFLEMVHLHDAERREE